jgi:putative solute:sodium symporter small subunit
VSMKVHIRSSYHRVALRLLLSLLSIWFVLSFGCAILWRDWLDVHAPLIGQAPFGFWMAQQGSILGFVALLIIYAVAMNRLDRRYREMRDGEDVA